ncbi:MAG: response regulator [Proteobacteria bacterium]|nr:response regulator [Pseudomonadota bacterium]MBU1714588.1 response regulator [Pseudomonadota bacterium]
MSQHNKAKILIVDDHPENLHALREVISPLKAEIISALSGQEALALMVQHEFAAVLLDVQMPEMDGFETATLMQNNKSTRGVPIIFVTAINKEQKHIFKGYQTGAVDYIFKPFDPDILLCKLQVFINLYNIRVDYSRLQEELMKARNLESLGLVAGGIAHDFNNLLFVIMGSVDMAQEEFSRFGYSSKLLDEAMNACKKASDLTNKLIVFSKGGHLEKVSVSLPEIIESIGRELYNGSGIEFTLKSASDLWPVKGDRFQLEQVFANILKNGKEALGSRGKMVVRIENYTNEADSALTLAKGPYLKITFTDDGPGIAPDIFHKIFDPYFSTKDMSANKGLGLGLALCHSIVARHDGLLTVDSVSGAGASFTIYLLAEQTAADRANN